MIRREKGFTLIEIMMVIAILGILGATAIPVFRTWQMRAMGTEANIMAKQILDAQIVYYLDNNNFYPSDNTPVEIYHDDPPNSQNIKNVLDNLNITIPTGHFLNYIMQPDNFEGLVTLQISSYTGYDIFKESNIVQYTLYKDGSIDTDYL